MMNELITNNIRRLLNKEVARRMLIRYFCDKGFSENFNQKVYPPAIQDITEQIPDLASKLEIIPSAEDVDPRTNYAKIRWDLYVLGNQRLFLGYTEHPNLNEIVRQVGSSPLISEKVSSSYESTAARIVVFITRVLADSEQGFLRHNEETHSMGLVGKISNSGSLYRRGAPARFEGSSR